MLEVSHNEKKKKKKKKKNKTTHREKRRKKFIREFFSHNVRFFIQSKQHKKRNRYFYLSQFIFIRCKKKEAERQHP